MQATTLVSVEEYDHMTFEHDAEYVLGRIVYRPMPTYPHARLQAKLTIYFGNHEHEWGLIVVTEQRVRIAPGVFRIPDICLLREAPEADYVINPPVIAVEILSPDESAKELSEKIVEYLDFGVEAVWVMDPMERNGTVYPRDSRPAESSTASFATGPSKWIFATWVDSQPTRITLQGDMQATTLVSVEEYDHMTFEHDAEYVLGRIVYRPMPTYPHARLQTSLSAFFYSREPETGLIVVTEQRVRIALGVFRIPDICLLREAPETNYVTNPPVIAVEILSPDESAKELSEKIVEYLDFGVEAVWVMDPEERNGTIYPRDGRPRRVEDGMFRHGALEVNIRDLG